MTGKITDAKLSPERSPFASIMGSSSPTTVSKKSLDFATENVLYHSSGCKCALFQSYVTVTFQIFQKNLNLSYSWFKQKRVSFSSVLSSSQSTCDAAVHGSELSQQIEQYWYCYTNTQSKEAGIHGTVCRQLFYFSAAVTLHLQYICILLRRIFSMKYHLRHRFRLTWHVC